MFNLVLAILMSSMISIVMRLCQGRIHAKISMLSANYLTCMVCASFFLQPKVLIPTEQGSGFTVALGVFNGMIYLVSLMLAQYNIRRNGVVLQSVFSKIGDLMVPLFFAIVVFSEKPGILQIIGSVLAIGAILGMNMEGKQGSGAAMLPLLALFFVDGMTGSTSKIYEQMGNTGLSSHFLFFTFASAFVFSLCVVLKNWERPGIWELLFGIAIGIPNYFSSRFLLRALSTVPAVVAYPIRSVSSIVLIAMTGVLVFHEKLRKVQWAAIAVILLAVILLSI